MASKRMFDKQLVETDKFCDMPLSAKALYFLLGMEADDEGFVSPRRVMRIHGGSEDDLKVLAAKEYVIVFESGVIVITDWNKNNYLQKNRIKATEHVNEKAQICVIDERYVKHDDINGLTNVKQMFNQHSIAERSVAEKRGEENSVENIDASSDALNNAKPKKTPKRFIPPTVEEVAAYCRERNNGIDAEAFVAYYDSKNWMIGSNKMTKWKSAIVTWEKRNKPKSSEVNQNVTIDADGNKTDEFGLKVY